ncbi:hypothetical protein ACJ73_09822 [Blastomyces percursus]|uniref:Integrase zinc-binding domain-containing protein n=1 Tax=Blastomyces percursus TaxID=1658174 RepID=A0A1J9P0M3_9EURO|nr:hypothetical protein ACJ73_09822 [Blastomyces percursus]
MQLEQQIAEAIDERNEYRNAYAALAREHHAMRQSPMPQDHRERSVKLPDPPLLTDGKDPKFEDWYSKMKGKLEGNADHYTTEALRMAYVESRTGGNATAREMLDCLKTIYLDPNRVQNAKTEFRRLVMRRTDDFHQFLTRFLHLAGESELPVSEYKYELNEKLSFDLQKLVITEFHASSSFDTFSKHCSQVAHTLKKINDIQSRTRKPNTQDVTKDMPSSAPLPYTQGARTSPAGKRVALGQVSFLGNAVSRTIDLGQLIDGNAFLVECQIARNGIAVTLKSLVDSGANGYLFISWKLAEQVVKGFGIQVVKLDAPVDVIGFDGKTKGQAAYVVGLHFQVAGRRFQKLPFLILDIGKQDLIIGRKFLEQHDIWLDEIKILRRELTVPEVKPEHEADADRRDQQMEKADQNKHVQWTPTRTEAQGHRTDLRKMEQTLKDKEPTTQVLLPKENLDPTILEELNSMPQVAVMAIDEGLGLVGKLITFNKVRGSLREERLLAAEGSDDWKLDNGLLLYQERLVVPETEDHIRTQLIKEVHDQISTARPGRTKTRKLLTSRYYWKGMGKDIDRYVRNCHTCRRSHVPRDMPPGLLKSLPIPQRSWQYISMDFQ